MRGDLVQLRTQGVDGFLAAQFATGKPEFGKRRFGSRRGRDALGHGARAKSQLEKQDRPAKGRTHLAEQHELHCVRN